MTCPAVTPLLHASARGGRSVRWGGGGWHYQSCGARSQAVMSLCSAATLGSLARRVRGNVGAGTPIWARSLRRARMAGLWRPSHPSQTGHRTRMCASRRPTVASDRRVPARARRATVTRPRPQVGCVPRSVHTHIRSSGDHVGRRVVCGRLDRARKGLVGCAVYRLSQRESVERWMPQCAQVALTSSPWAKYQSIHCRRCRVVGWGMAVTSRQAKCRRCL
jgi:hypothetical protein